jgi:MYXO-CTERM domain-containing protein
MPWWGNQSLAQTFATVVGTQLGLPILGTEGPLFAYNQYFQYDDNLQENISSVNTYSYDTTSSPPVIASRAYAESSWHYAIASVASPPPAPVPGPLPLMGAAAAFGWSRKLRRHISPLSAR